jgi:hypothetical protein
MIRTDFSAPIQLGSVIKSIPDLQCGFTVQTQLYLKIKMLVLLVVWLSTKNKHDFLFDPYIYLTIGMVLECISSL